MPKQENSMVLVDQQFRMITPAGSINDAIQQFQLYQQLKEKLATEDDFQPIAGKKHPKKSFVRKVQRFFNLSCELLRDEPLKDENGKIIAWVALARAIHTPTGAYQDADGSCSFDEKIEQQRTVHNIRAHAITRAKNRAILDLVGFGEVSAEEIIATEESNGETSGEMTYEKAANTVVNFGKHKGKKLSDIPEDYIQWLVKNAKKDDLKMACVVYLDGPEKEWEPVDDEDLPINVDDDLPFNNNPVPDPDRNDGRHYCNGCGLEVTKARATLSKKKYGETYCISCKE